MLMYECECWDEMWELRHLSPTKKAFYFPKLFPKHDEFKFYRITSEMANKKCRCIAFGRMSEF